MVVYLRNVIISDDWLKGMTISGPYIMPYDLLNSFCAIIQRTDYMSRTVWLYLAALHMQKMVSTARANMCTLIRLFICSLIALWCLCCCRYRHCRRRRHRQKAAEKRTFTHEFFNFNATYFYSTPLCNFIWFVCVFFYLFPMHWKMDESLRCMIVNFFFPFNSFSLLLLSYL